MSPKEVLIAVRAKIADPSRWTQYHYARDENGKSVPPRSPEAACWCIRGAILTITPGSGLRPNGPGIPAEEVLSKLLNEGRDTSAIARFNDAVKTQHADVIALLDRAIESCT